VPLILALLLLLFLAGNKTRMNEAFATSKPPNAFTGMIRWSTQFVWRLHGFVKALRLARAALGKPSHNGNSSR
jgi:hypothetical protein